MTAKPSFWFHNFAIEWTEQRADGSSYDERAIVPDAGLLAAIAAADREASTTYATEIKIKRTERARNVLATVYDCTGTDRAAASAHYWREVTERGNPIAYHDERLAAFARLRAWLKPGSVVYTVLRSVSRSGMMRQIDVYGLSNGTDETSDRPFHVYLSRPVALVLDYPTADNGALRVAGCGMDMGFAVAHSLSYALHGNKDVGSDAIERGAAGRPFQPTSEQFRAGYSLTHEWI